MKEMVADANSNIPAKSVYRKLSVMNELLTGGCAKVHTLLTKIGLHGYDGNFEMYGLP